MARNAGASGRVRHRLGLGSGFFFGREDFRADQEHAITYVRMLDADAEGADWREVARIELHIDPDRKPDRRPSRATLLAPNG